MHTVFHLQDELVRVLASTMALSVMQMLQSLCKLAVVDLPTAGYRGKNGARQGYWKRRTFDGRRHCPEETLPQSQREEQEDDKASVKTS